MADSMETITFGIVLEVLTEPKVGWKRLKLYDFENSLMLLYLFFPKMPVNWLNEIIFVSQM